jgi:hypothetical protein
MSNWKEIAISLAVVIVGVVVATLLYKQAQKLITNSSSQDSATVNLDAAA